MESVGKGAVRNRYCISEDEIVAFTPEEFRQFLIDEVVSRAIHAALSQRVRPAGITRDGTIRFEPAPTWTCVLTLDGTDSVVAKRNCSDQTLKPQTAEEPTMHHYEVSKGQDRTEMAEHMVAIANIAGTIRAFHNDKLFIAWPGMRPCDVLDCGDMFHDWYVGTKKTG